MKIRVGNLSPATRKADLLKAFASYGEVTRVKVVKDKDTGERRGFAFVDMTSEDDGHKAIAGLNEVRLQGNVLAVREARFKPKS